MNTAQGLQVHCEQVHKIKLTGVPGAKEGRENMQIEIFGMAGIPSDLYQGAPPEQFRKATKRQVMLGAALVDEKGNFIPTPPANPAPILSPLIAPPIQPPPRPLFQPGAVPTGQPVTPVQTPSYGGLVSTDKGAVLQPSAPLVFPQGVAYTSSQKGESASQGMPAATATQAFGGSEVKATQGTLPQHMPAFIFPQSIVMHGAGVNAAQPRSRFVWKNEDVSVEEVRAKLEKYASLNNLA